MASKPAQFMEKVEVMLPGKNMFDLSHDHITTGKMGDLIPFQVTQCIPGDRHKIRTSAIVRMAPMISPPYGRVRIKTSTFFVPDRILWDNFEEYYRNDQTPKKAPPTMTYGEIEMTGDTGKHARYMGVPPYPTGGAPASLVVNALPFAAVQCCYNEYFRDQNLESEVNYKLVDGDNSANAALYQLRRTNWQKDYLTSALPFAQKGPAVSIPVGNFQDVPVKINDDGGSTITATPSNIPVDGEAVTEPLIPENTLYAETSLLDAEATTINTWRRLLRLQEYYERLARVGSRFIEVLKGFFGAAPSDERLQRPEYICGSSSSMRISEVLNTTGTPDAPQGNMAGHGIGTISGDQEWYDVKEPGWLISFIRVLPDTVYFEGLARHLMPAGDVMDSYVWPQFANIGEQPVENQEVFAWTADPEERTETWAYQPIYASHRYQNSRISGDFQDTLKFWTMAREFGALPPFDSEFIKADPTDRIFAVQDGTDTLWMHIEIDLQSLRPLPIFGTPTV